MPSRCTGLRGLPERQQWHVVEVGVPVAVHARVLDLDEHHFAEEVGRLVVVPVGRRLDVGAAGPQWLAVRS